MAVLSVAVILAICLFLDRLLSGSLPLTLFIIPVAVSAWFGGLGPGLLATLLSGLASEYFLTEHNFSLFVMDTADWERLTLFLATSGLLNWLILTMRAAKSAVEARAQEALQRQVELEEQILERERARAERERLIAEIETERARLNAIIEHIPAGVLLAEAPGGRIVMGNPQVERILGHPVVLSPDIESYRDWMAYWLNGRRVEGRESVLARTLRGEVVNSQEILYHRGDGRKVWISVSGAPISDAGGNIVGGVVLITDIDEEKRARETLRRQTEALREADRRKDEFLAILAHELRNPLAPIRNAVSILSLRGDDPAVVAQTGELIDRQVHQMTRLVDDLLEISRIGRGKISLQKEPIDLARIVDMAVETSRPIIEAHRHTLTVSLPDRPLRVEADAARLAQVFSNLLNNAAKYTEDGGRIDLIVEEAQGEAVIRVRDNGIGIAPERLPDIFDMFSQIEGASDRSQGGLGIGLTLARRLVEIHGGKIEAFSAGLGKGSEFITRLPALAGAASDPAAKAVEEVRSPSADCSKRVLVVDDNADSAESMAVLLRLYGHEVRLAHDGETALEQARAFRPDVMFLDLHLPKMDGYEVARRLRQEPAMSGMALVAMTGYGQEEERRRTQETGFNLHLVKPVDFDSLQELLSSLPANDPGMREDSTLPD